MLTRLPDIHLRCLKGLGDESVWGSRQIKESITSKFLTSEAKNFINFIKGLKDEYHVTIYIIRLIK